MLIRERPFLCGLLAFSSNSRVPKATPTGLSVQAPTPPQSSFSSLRYRSASAGPVYRGLSVPKSILCACVAFV